MLLPMTYACVAIATMLIAVGEDALVALTGPSKIASGEVFVVVGTTLALFPLLDISSYGLLLRKRSVLVFWITALAAALNAALNLVLIPRYGYMGAAWATAASYAVLSIARYIWCPRALVRFPDLRTLGLSVGSALLLLAVVEGTDMFGVQGPWPRLLVAGGLFVLLYALPIWLFDPRLRNMVRQWRSGGT
jgi:O-antigen/teichoic acid export membrane protein